MLTESRIRILIADDHAIVREGLQAPVEAKPDMEMIGEAAIAFAGSLKPEVVLMDLAMPNMNGVEGCK